MRHVAAVDGGAQRSPRHAVVLPHTSTLPAQRLPLSRLLVLLPHYGCTALLKCSCLSMLGAAPTLCARQPSVVACLLARRARQLGTHRALHFRDQRVVGNGSSGLVLLHRLRIAAELQRKVFLRHALGVACLHDGAL